MSDTDFYRLYYAAELINLDPYDPSRAEVIPGDETYYWILYANLIRDDTIYIKMDKAHFDQSQMFD